MKKNHLAILVISICLPLMGQNAGIYSDQQFKADEVKSMAVFPGCENVDEFDLRESQKCLSIRLNELLLYSLSDFADEMQKRKEVFAQAKIQFVINIQGRIVKIEALPGGSLGLKTAAVGAMEKIAKTLERIQPATLEDGTPVNLVFQIPVKYFIQGESMLSKIPWKEYVVVTFFDGNRKYELRHDKKFVFKIYEVKDGKSVFVRNFKILDEVYATEPYASLLKSQNQKLMMAENKVGSVFYRFYYNSDNSYDIDVYKVIADKEVYLDTINKGNIQYIAEYAKVVLRQ